LILISAHYTTQEVFTSTVTTKLLLSELHIIYFFLQSEDILADKVCTIVLTVAQLHPLFVWIME